jgi:hypothetical protein
MSTAATVVALVLMLLLAACSESTGDAQRRLENLAEDPVVTLAPPGRSNEVLDVPDGCANPESNGEPSIEVAAVHGLSQSEARSFYQQRISELGWTPVDTGDLGNAWLTFERDTPSGVDYLTIALRHEGEARMMLGIDEKLCS